MSQESDVIGSGDGRKVLIFTATAGGGHVACARAMQDVLQQAGHQAVVLDGLEVMSRRLRWFQVDFYAWQLEHTPWTYAFGFWILGIPPVPAIVRFLIGFFWGDKLLKCISEENPDVVVSTYPVITGGLGRLVADGRLKIPVVAAVSDFGAHPMWVSPQVGLHLVLCQKSRELVEKAGGRARVMIYPINERFHTRMTRAEARQTLGLPADAVIPLIVGGTWGVGDIEGAAESSVSAGAYPIVVTAGNAELKASLENRYPGLDDARIYGWTNEMPTLMAASDCLIQNAGGVTCLEAMAVGLPIVFFHPIPGHGVFNAQIMEEAGAAHWANGNGELETMLRAIVAGTTTLAPPHTDPGVDVVSAVINTPPRSIPARTRTVWHPRPIMAAAAMVVLIWLSFSPWVIALAAGRTPLPVIEDNGPPGTVVVAVRADNQDVARALEEEIEQGQLPVALFVDAKAAAGLDPSDSVTFGIALYRSGGRLRHPVEQWRRIRESSEKVQQETGVEPRYVLPAPGGTCLIDVAMAPRHTRVVLDKRSSHDALGSGIIVVETTGLTADEAIASLQKQLAQVQSAGLTAIPLADLS